jgi:putative nucleotidyltransferase with HDIG domain
MQEIIEDSVDAKSQRDVKDLLRSLLETWVMPVAQTTLAKLDELCQNKRSASEIAECIATDACMTADLIRSMNHPDFGLPRKVVTPYEGILWAGVEKVMTAVASFPVFSSDGSGDTAVPHTFTRDLWAHCALTGRYAKAVAEKMRLSRDDQYRAQVAGVMHDIGKVFIIKDHWRVYRDVIDRCQKEKESLNKLEQQLLGLSHAELGGRLLERWNLDPEITDTIRFHHSPRLSQSKKVFGILAAVHIADAVASEAVGAQAPFKALVDVEYLYEINAYREYPSLRMHCLAQDK